MTIVQDAPLPYGPQLLYDVVHCTETAMSQLHAFLAMELVKAQAMAERIGHLEESL